MDYLEEAKSVMAKIMLDYRYRIEELEQAEYEKINEIALEVLKKIPIHQYITHNGEYCKFIEVVPSKQIFRVFKGDRVIELSLDEVFNICLR